MAGAWDGVRRTDYFVLYILCPRLTKIARQLVVPRIDGGAGSLDSLRHSVGNNRKNWPHTGMNGKAVQAVNRGKNATANSSWRNRPSANINILQRQRYDDTRQAATPPRHSSSPEYRIKRYRLLSSRGFDHAHADLLGQGSTVVFPMVLDKIGGDGIPR